MKEQVEKRFTILVIGERALQDAVRRCLPEEEQAELSCCASEEKAHELLAKRSCDVIVADFDLPQFKPIKFLSVVLNNGKRHEIVLVAEAPAIETVVKCMQLGASDFLQLPRENAKLHEALKKAHAQWRQNQNGAVFQAEQHERFSARGIIGQCAQMQQLHQLIERITSRRWATVLILGETGTGKEVVARAIHYGSAASSSRESFVEVNCTAIPENLLEAELFGHEKGAFTDAKFSKKGLFELAEGGTLFLDEIGDMSLTLQAKLLKAIEEKRFRRLGGTSSIEVKTRIMAGTHANLEKAITEGRFRRDLYYRLNVINIHLPSLRERGKDILLLAHHFLNTYAVEYDAVTTKFSPAAEEVLLSYDWPGNVRELQHAVERAALLGDNAVIEAKEIYEALGLEPRPQAVRAVTATAPATAPAEWSRVIEIPPEGLSLQEGESKLIQEILRLTKWNKTRASQILGISRPRLARKIEEYRITDPREKRVELAEA